VVLALALLVVGGVALWGALTSEPAAPAPGASRADPPASAEAAPSSRQRQSASTSTARVTEALVVRCRSAGGCRVFIASTPGNEVLFNGTLGQSETRQYDERRMALVVADAGAVDVYINGKLQPKAPGERKTYAIVKS
jgi:hypothetical protein